MNSPLLAIVLFLVFVCVVALAWLVGRAPIASHEDAVTSDILTEVDDFIERINSVSSQIAELAVGAAVSRGRLEQGLGLPVYGIDLKQNAPTSMTIQ